MSREVLAGAAPCCPEETNSHASQDQAEPSEPRYGGRWRRAVALNGVEQKKRVQPASVLPDFHLSPAVVAVAVAAAAAVCTERASRALLDEAIL